MIHGKKYKLIFEDCCVVGFIIGTFLSVKDDGYGVTNYIFNTGEVQLYVSQDPDFEEVI